MKKSLWIVLLLTLVCTLALSACDDTNQPQTPNEDHVHAFSEWTTVKDATCTVKGEQERSCSCGEKETQSIDATGHTEVVDAAVAPACNATGLTEGKHCSVCNETIVAQEVVAKLEHTPATDAAVEATCSATGLTEGSHCSVCNAVITAQQVVAKKAHTTSDWITDTEATCSVAGAKHKECTVCHTVLESGSIDKIAHTPETDAAIAPTLTSRGKTEGCHCFVCGEIIVAQQEIATLWDGKTITAPSKIININGTYYYEINSAEELAYLSLADSKWMSYNYILTCNIMLNNIDLTYDEEGYINIDTSLLNIWYPIGYENGSYYGLTFSGIFDGNEHTVSGVFIPSNVIGGMSNGFFRSNDGTIKNLNISNAWCAGGWYFGGVCGNNYGVIDFCSFDGLILSGTNVGGIVGDNDFGETTNCINYGKIQSGKSCVGGIVGECGTVNNCMNYGSITGEEKVGGIVGFASRGTVSQCTNNGDIAGINDIGGIIGQWGKLCLNCTNNGIITGIKNVGGISGTNTQEIKNCYNKGIIKGDSYVGGVIGSCERETPIISSCYNLEKIDGKNNVGGISGYCDIYFSNGFFANNYYLKTETINKNINGFANTEDVIGIVEAVDKSFFESQDIQ